MSLLGPPRGGVRSDQQVTEVGEGGHDRREDQCGAEQSHRSPSRRAASSAAIRHGMTVRPGAGAGNVRSDGAHLAEGSGGGTQGAHLGPARQVGERARLDLPHGWQIDPPIWFDQTVKILACSAQNEKPYIRRWYVGQRAT